jgi:hypothetical protein
VASEFNTALLRIELRPRGAMVDVVVPDADTPQVTRPRVPQLAGRS